MEMIKWMEPRVTRAMHQKEVHISTTSWQDKPYTIISFRDGANLKITKGDRIRVGITASRMYFDESSKGYALSKSGNITRFCKLPGKRENFVGDYNLQFDAENKMWFIGV